MRTATITFTDSTGRTITGVLKTRSPQLSSQAKWTGDQALLDTLSHQLRDFCSMGEFVAECSIFSREKKLAMKASYAGTYDIVSELRL